MTCMVQIHTYMYLYAKTYKCIYAICMNRLNVMNNVIYH